MIVPSSRLLLVAAVVVLPLVTVAGMAPALAAPVTAALVVCALVAALDGARGLQRVQALAASTPGVIRLTKDLPARLPVTIENRAGAAIGVRTALLCRPGWFRRSRWRRSTLLPARAGSIGRVRECSAAIMPCAKSTWKPPHRCGCGWRGARARELRLARLSQPARPRHGVAFSQHRRPGVRLRRQIGKGREFDNLRHYLPGDSFEDIHWKATARRGYPVVKLYRVEHAQEVYAIVDASRLSAREGILESYVDAALHLALVAERQGDRFGLVTFSDRTDKFVRARNGHGRISASAAKPSTTCSAAARQPRFPRALHHACR